MRKIFVLAAAMVALAALAPGSSSGAITLKSLNKKLNCLVRYPAVQFPDYAWYGLIGAPQPSSANVPPTFAGFDPANPATYPPADPPLRNWGPTTGLDLAYDGPPDAWLVGVKKTSKCLRRFDKAANPHPARPASLRLHRLAAWR